MTSPGVEYPPKWQQKAFLSIQDLLSIKDIKDIDKIRATLDHQSVIIEDALQDQLSSRATLMKSQRKTFQERVPSLLAPLVSDAIQLEASLVEASKLAEEASSKVRKLDTIRSRLVSADKKNEELMKLRTCTKGTLTSLASKNYDEAVSHLSTFLKSDKSSCDDETIRLMANAESSLVSALHDQLNLAIERNDITNIVRYTKLFSPLGRYDEGVTLYAGHLQKQIKIDADSILAQIDASTKESERTGSGSKPSFASALAQLVTRAHKRLKIARPTLEQSFGPSGLIHAVLILQPTIVSHCSTVLDEFMKSWQGMEPQKNVLKSRQDSEASLNRRNLETGYTSNPSTSKSILEFSPLLDQLVIISQTIEVNSRFSIAVVAQAREALKILKSKTTCNNTLNNTARNTDPQLPTNSPTMTTESESSNIHFESTASRHLPLSDVEQAAYADSQINMYSRQLEAAALHGPLSERLLELVAHYIRFEQYYLQESVIYAISNDNASQVDKSHRTSTICDDVFFVFKESSNRAKATYNCNALCAVINLIDTELNSNYYSVLKNRSSREALQAFKAAQVGNIGSPTPPSVKHVLVAINNLEQTCEYINRLKADIEGPSAQIFALQADDLHKVNLCCDELSRTEGKFKQIVQEQIDQIFSALKPRLLVSVEILNGINYSLSFSDYQTQESIMIQACHSIQEMIVPIQAVLSQTNFEVLLNSVASAVFSYFERLILQKEFSEAGAEQFDKDIRMLKGFLITKMNRSVQEKWTRLSQISFLLNSSSLDEAQDQWKSTLADREKHTQTKGTISQADMNSILNLRKDWIK